MGDLDVSLIREFEARPAFYDRNDPYYKDKIYCENGWEDISNALGYDVGLLKDRMLQLRNRYNLEKRRLEQLMLENPHKQITSPWPLFGYLNFLSNHIRSRRSYKSMMTRSNQVDIYSNSNSNNGSPGDAVRKSESYEQEEFDGFEDIQVKLEKQEDCDKIQPEQSTSENAQLNAIQQTIQQNSTQQNFQPNQIQQNVSLTKNDDGKRINQLNHPSQNIREPSFKRCYPFQHQRYYPPPIKRQRFEGRSEKFEAFGRFLSTSLCDLPENRALELVQKFTSELVKAFLTPENKKRAQTNNTRNSGNSFVKENGISNCIDDSSEDGEEEEEEEDDVQII